MHSERAHFRTRSDLMTMMWPKPRDLNTGVSLMEGISCVIIVFISIVIVVIFIVLPPILIFSMISIIIIVVAILIIRLLVCKPLCVG